MIQGRSYIKMSNEVLLHEIDIYDWSKFNNSNDVILCWAELEKAIRVILDKYCPLKPFEIPEYRDPWFTQDVYEQIRDKNQKAANARVSGLDTDWDIADKAKNTCNKKVERMRQNFFKEQLETYKKDPKAFWRIINNLIPGQPNKPKDIELIDHNSDTKAKIPSSEVPNFINNYFTQIGPELAKDLHVPWKQYDNEVLNVIDPFETNLIEVNKLVNEINVNKSSAIDNISSKILKTVFKHIPDKLVKIFNLSFSQNLIPPSWKISKVTPIPKSGNLKLVNNYRPISLLPLPCKMLEKIVHSRVYGFLSRENVLTNAQGGFRRGHSTVNTLACFTDDIRRELNVGNNTIAAFIDLRKAFDTVDHSVLLLKIKHYGINSDNYHWFENYLDDRFQTVFANGILSTKEKITCGVPQGSILGPLLFLIYVNDVVKCIKNCKIKLYADDTVIYTAKHNFQLASNMIQEDLDCYSTWCKQNKLSVNATKTKIMIFAASSNKLKTLDVNITLDDHILQVVPSYKYLGVILDPLLKFNLHLKFIAKTVAYKTYKLCNLRPYLNQRLSVNIFVATILPYLDYADILFSTTHDNLLKPLQYAQNRCLKICLKYPHLTSTDVVHSDANCNYLSDRRRIHMENFMYKRSRDDTYVDDRNIRTRAFDGPMVKVLHSNSATYDRSVEFRGAVIWNGLAPERRNIPNFDEFKIKSLSILKALRG